MLRAFAISLTFVAIDEREDSAQMHEHFVCRSTCVLVLIVIPVAASAQTATYHLHKESSKTTGLLQLKSVAPDANATTITFDLKNQPANEYLVKAFDTAAGTPGTGGVIPAGSVVSFTLWMRKTTTAGVLFPRAKLKLNAPTGAAVCDATGNTPLTTTIAAYTLTCAAGSNVTMTTADRLYVWTGVIVTGASGNSTLKAELHIEGALNGNYDSRIAAPIAIQTPIVASVSPTSGRAGTAVVIAGANFGATQSSSTVAFNGTVAAATSWSPASIRALVPASATSGPIVVTVRDLASNGVAFAVAPGIANLSPPSGDIATPVTIAGSGFGTAQGASTVTFAGVAASPVSWSVSSIVVPVPAGATSGEVVVTVGDLASNPAAFGVPPIVNGIAPAAAHPGATVTITGTHFDGSPAAAVVTFNGTPATTTRWTDTSIDAVVPAGATSGDVVVTVVGYASNRVPFTVMVPGTIAGVVSRADGGGAIAGAAVVLSSRGSIVGGAASAADGSYAIDDVDPGTFDLTITAPGFATEQRSGIRLEPGATATVNVSMLQTGSVEGTVTAAGDSAPVVGALVRAADGAGNASTASTDLDGRYRIVGLRPGTFTVTASAVRRRTAEQSAVVGPDAATVTNFALEDALAGPVSYAYDALGRLIQVTDAAGDFAVYRYDAVGNLLAIDRPRGSVSIAGFAPTAGAAGDTVTIVGGGFGSAGQNVVLFNGVTAPMASETATQLVVSVPQGATTGPIVVTAPSGSAASDGPFTVVLDGGRPRITSIIPTIGVSGAAFSILGSNFDPSPANDRIDVNGRVAAVPSASPAALATNVPPAAMGGRVTVTTPLGRAVSDADFVVVPAPYTPADVDVADRLTIGVSKSIAITTANKIALLLFDGVSGQRVSFLVANSSLGGGAVNIFRPDAVQMAGAGSIGTNTFIDSQVLPITGTYTIEIDPASTATGSLTLVSFDLTDVTGSIVPNGPGVAVSVTSPGQNVFLSFTGVAGQLISATATSSTWTSCQFGGQYSLAVLNPDGSLLANFTNACGATTTLERQLLPSTGRYTIRLDPYGTNTGSATIALYQFTDVTLPIMPNGSSVPVSITVPGQVALLTFSGTAGQVIAAASTSSTWTSCQFGGQYNFGVVKPDGSLLVLATNACGPTTYIDRVTLPITGTYAVRVDPYGANTGSTSVTLYDVVDVTGQIALDGTSVPVAISSPSQNALLTFTGTAGQIVSAVAVTPWAGCWDSPHFYLRILAPDGSAVTSTYDACTGGTALADHIALPVSGTYTLMLDPIGTLTGDTSVSAYTFSDVSGSIVANGGAVGLTISAPGQNARFTFSGAAGQVVSASASTPWGGCIDSPHFYLNVLAPNGSVLTSTYDACTGGRASTGQITLPTAGTYTVMLDPIWTRTGAATVTLTSP